MKQIENIFSKKKTKSTPPIQKIPIIIDTREKQSLVVANLIEKKANIQTEKLEIGDYLIEDTIIERKTFQDFIGSMINKRLISQLQEIKKYPKHFLIIEGFNYEYNKFNIHENAVRGMFLSIAIDFQTPIIFTENQEDTANFLILVAKKYERPNQKMPIRHFKTLKTPKEQKQFIIEGFPGIGPVSAQKLLNNFPTLKNIFNTTEKQLKKIGLADDKIKKFLGLLNSSEINQQS
jgi:ERCC4-type nuclease